MAITKADIVNIIAENLKFKKTISSEKLDTLIGVIKNRLSAGEGILVSGFGKFRVLDKSPRRGRNPATGEDLLLKARKVVTFKCSSTLRKKINGE